MRTWTSLKTSSRTIALCSAANLINAADRAIMPIAIIPMTSQYRWPLTTQGWILSSFAFGYITSQIIGSGAASRFGGKRVLLGAVLLWSTATLLTPVLAYHIPSLIILRILLGLGEGLGLPTMFAIFAHSIPVHERSRAFSYLVGAGTIGQTFAAIICPHLPWKWMFFSFGGLGVTWCAIFMAYYSDLEDGSNPDQIPLVNTPRTKYVHWTRFISLWPLWAIYIAHFAMNWTNYIVMQWLPTYLVRTLGADKEAMSLTALPYLVNSITGIFCGHWADALIEKGWPVLKVRRIMTFIGLVGPAVFLLVFCTVNSLLAAVFYISVSMALCSFNSAGHLSNHADVAPTHAGVTFAVSNTIATIPGILAGPLTASLVTQSHGRWWPVFVLAALINLVGSVIYVSQSSANGLL